MLDYKKKKVFEHDADSDDYVEMDEAQEKESFGGSISKDTINSPQTQLFRMEGNESPKKKSEVVEYQCPKFGSKILLVVALVVTVSLIFVLVIGAVIFAMYAKVIAIESSMEAIIPDIADINQQLLRGKDESLTELISNQLSEIKEQLTGQCITREESLQGYQRLNGIYHSSSCESIWLHNPSSPSGYYVLRLGTGHLISVYCDMNRTCGNSSTGGWRRVAKLDVNNCPEGFRSEEIDGLKTCIVIEDEPNCTAILFPYTGMPYSRVCGLVRGYAIGTVDGISRNRRTRGDNINDNYLDGVSVTVNDMHIWSFVAGDCMCSYTKPFMSNDWTCDGIRCMFNYTCNEYIWDHRICGEQTPFLKKLPVNTTGAMKVRVCRDEPRGNEDIALTALELYAQ